MKTSKEMWKRTLGLGVAFGFMAIGLGASSGGCSSSSGSDNATPDASSDSPSHADGAQGGDDAASTCPSAPPTKADLDGEGGWKPPAAPNPSACTPTDLATFKTNFDGPGSWADTVAGLPAGCASCLLSQESDANWGPIVETDATGATGFVNFGACYAAKSGVEACGKAIEYSEFCINASCGDCADADYSACTSDSATTDACDAVFGSDVASACPQAQATELDTACGDIFAAAAFLCGGSAGDAGAD